MKDDAVVLRPGAIKKYDCNLEKSRRPYWQPFSVSKLHFFFFLEKVRNAVKAQTRVIAKAEAVHIKLKNTKHREGLPWECRGFESSAARSLGRWQLGSPRGPRPPPSVGERFISSPELKTNLSELNVLVLRRHNILGRTFRHIGLINKSVLKSYPRFHSQQTHKLLKLRALGKRTNWTL